MTSPLEPDEVLLLFAAYFVLIVGFLWWLREVDRARHPTTVRRRGFAMPGARP